MDLSTAHTEPAVSTSTRAAVPPFNRNHKPKLLPLNGKGMTMIAPRADAGITHSQTCFQLGYSSA